MSELFCGTVNEVFDQIDVETQTNKKHFIDYYEPYEKKELRKTKKGAKKVTVYTVDLELLKEMIVFVAEVRSANKTTQWPTSLKKAAAKFKEDYKIRKEMKLDPLD